MGGRAPGVPPPLDPPMLAYPVFPDTIQLTKVMLLLMEAFNRVGSVELNFILLLANIESDIVIFELDL